MIDFLATELMFNHANSGFEGRAYLAIEDIVEEGFEWIQEMETFLIDQNIAIPIIDEDEEELSER